MIGAVAAVSVEPASAGEAVMWAEESPNGATRIVMAAPGREPMLVHRMPPATARTTERGFSGTLAVFAASAERFAAIVHTSTVIFDEFDSITIAGAHAVISGRFKAPVEVLAGSLPRRDDQGCDGRPVYESPRAVDVDDDRVAFGLLSDECTANNGPWDDSVVVVDDGTVDFVVSNRHFSRLAWAAPGTPGARVIDRGRFSDLSLAGGRVLYERVVSERRFTGELLLRSLADGSARRLAFFPERRRRVDDLDLDATRATWAPQPTGRGYDPPARGPARIVVRAL